MCGFKKLRQWVLKLFCHQRISQTAVPIFPERQLGPSLESNWTPKSVQLLLGVGGGGSVTVFSKKHIAACDFPGMGSSLPVVSLSLSLFVYLSLSLSASLSLRERERHTHTKREIEREIETETKRERERDRLNPPPSNGLNCMALPYNHTFYQKLN